MDKSSPIFFLFSFSFCKYPDDNTVTILVWKHAYMPAFNLQNVPHYFLGMN